MRPLNLQTALQSIRGIHGYATHMIFTQVPLHFQYQIAFLWSQHIQSLINLGQVSLCKRYINHASKHLRYMSGWLCHSMPSKIILG
jgi:hypothetical protein